MSVKSQFFKKLQARQPAPVSFTSKTQADIAEFRLRMEHIREQMSGWLAGTGLETGMFTVSVTDLLVEGGAFDISGIILRVDDRTVKFVPVFLYGQSVTGCVEATFHDGEHLTPLGRLFMRSGTVNDWTFAPPGALTRAENSFNENTFFGLILSLLP